MTVRAAENNTSSLPPIQSLAVSSSGPRFRLRKVALGTQAISVIERRTLAALERKKFDIVGGMTGRAGRTGLPGMHRLDVLVRIGDALVSHHDSSSQMTGRTGELAYVGCARAQGGSQSDASKFPRCRRHGIDGAYRHFEQFLPRSFPLRYRGSADCGKRAWFDCRFPRRVPSGNGNWLVPGQIRVPIATGSRENATRGKERGQANHGLPPPSVSRAGGRTYSAASAFSSRWHCRQLARSACGVLISCTADGAA